MINKPDQRSYLGIPIPRPKAAFFEFTSCEGCQLQILNNEADLLDFLSLVEIVNFRESMTERREDYEIAFVEGSISREDEIERLKKIRAQADTLVALGSCACFGGVNQLKNRFADLQWVKKTVYGDHPVETSPVKPLSAIVKVDLEIYGCPISKQEVERMVTDLVIGKTVSQPEYPLCLECRANRNICLFDLGQLCLGPITRAGCEAWCPGNRLGCWGCRGPAEKANFAEFRRITAEHGFSREQLLDRLECFGGFAGYLAEFR
ncbi:MAG: NADH:ubiquinone oxidoreductase [Desulfurivibrionaceae bacterium]